MRNYGYVLITEGKIREVIVRLGVDRSGYLSHRKDSRENGETILLSKYGIDWTASEFYNKLRKIAGKSLRLRKNLGQLERLIEQIKQKETQ